MDRALVSRLLLKEAERFFRHRPPEAQWSACVAAVIAQGVKGPDDGEPALFAAIGLATRGDAAGLKLLRSPSDYFCTNSSIEVGLSMIARVVLDDLQPPLRFINATLIQQLAREVGAWPPLGR